MIQEIDESVLDDLKIYCDYTTRKMENLRAWSIYMRCIRNGKKALAEKIFAKWGSRLNEVEKSDMATSLGMALYAKKYLL